MWPIGELYSCPGETGESLTTRNQSYLASEHFVSLRLPMQGTSPPTGRSFAQTHESAPRGTWACLPHPPPLLRPWRQNRTHLVLPYSSQASQCWLCERRSSGAGARGGAVLDLLPVPWRVASFLRRKCAWCRCRCARVGALRRRVLSAAVMRVAALWRCSCLCPGSSRRVGGGGARVAAVVVLVSVPWRVASL